MTNKIYYAVRDSSRVMDFRNSKDMADPEARKTWTCLMAV